MNIPKVAKSSKNILARTLFCLSLFAPCVQSLADTSRRSPSDDGTFTAGPYYNSATRSYFELIRNNFYTWDQAEDEAANHSYKNTPGRLAVIDRPETHRFLVRNFTFLQDTWIGLRFFCEESTLFWPDGISHQGKPFSNWSITSEHRNLTCPQTGYLYTIINRNAFDWTLAQWNVEAQYTLIEYPTGRR
jgi:hypothetical protein|tara:strand:+ start:157111 stop:157677 length:567 start_codon:yes stop_codon:yes gene_type:complete